MSDAEKVDLKTYLQPGMKFYYAFEDGDRVVHEVLPGTNRTQLNTRYIVDGKIGESLTPWDEVDTTAIYVADIRTPLTPKRRTNDKN